MKALLGQALAILDAEPAITGWSLGGGTVLMLRHRHRVSRGVEIFLPDAQTLDGLKARLQNQPCVAEPGALRVYLAEGEIDFIVSRALTTPSVRKEKLLGRSLWVQTSAEIVAQKLWHRAARFSARDLADFAIVARRERRALAQLEPVIAARRATLLDRLERHEAALREDFAALELLGSIGFEECLALVRKALERGHRAEQPAAGYVAGYFLRGFALAGAG